MLTGRAVSPTSGLNMSRKAVPVTPVTASAPGCGGVWPQRDQMAALTDQTWWQWWTWRRWISPRKQLTPFHSSHRARDWCGGGTLSGSESASRRRTDQTENSETELPSAGRSRAAAALFIKERQEQPMSVLVSSISVPFQKGEAAAVELALRRGRDEEPQKRLHHLENSVSTARSSLSIPWESNVTTRRKWCGRGFRCPPAQTPAP